MENNANLPTQGFWQKNKKTIIIVVVIVVILIILYFWMKKKNKAQEQTEQNFKKDDDDGKKPEVKGLIGKAVFPKPKLNVAEVRNSPHMKKDNIIGQTKYPDEVGRILSVQMNKDEGKLWYKIRMPNKIGNKYEGFVREDMVNLSDVKYEE
jgi:hypothetical protein